MGQNVGQLVDPHRDPHAEINCTLQNGHVKMLHGPIGIYAFAPSAYINDGIGYLVGSWDLIADF